MIRRTLLWASRSRWLGRTLPRRRFVRRAVRRFIPGEDRASALREALLLRDRGIRIVFTYLGEKVATPEGVGHVVVEYEALLEEAVSRAIEPQISVKLTQLGLDLGEHVALEALEQLLVKAQSVGGFVWVDMEESSYRERTLRVFQSALGRSAGDLEGEGSMTPGAWSAGPGAERRVGLCLQAYLRSTPEDLDDLLPLSPALRLVKGAYAEGADLALPRKAEVDEAYVQCAFRVLGTPGAWLGLATHDSVLIRRLRSWIEQRGIDGQRYEYQMLYGIQSETQRRMAREGEPVRVLISYGPEWFPWYMRRLAERPANLWFVLRNLFRG